jgi:hypothetical protein
MIALSKSARRSLDDYLRQARTYLRGSRTVDADEVEQNITEHIEDALEGAAEPVSCDALEAVLDKLGDPQQWVPEEELSWWRQFILRLRTGPEDWRLAYISFALFVVALTLAPITPVFVVLVFASFITSRAAISHVAGAKELKAQKWLLYPPLIVVYGSVLGALLILPLLLLVPLAEEYETHFVRLQFELDYWFVAFSIMFAATGTWLAILALLALIFGKKMTVLLRPFADAYRAKWPLVILTIGLGVMIISAIAAIVYYTYFT